MVANASLLYLAALAGILGVVGFFVLRGVLRLRAQEKVIRELQPRLSKGKGSPQEHYELGSVYLQKGLYEQAIVQLKKALEVAGENIPPVCNALGFAYFSQGQYDLAIRYYKDAVAADPAYVTAWNNLGHAYEKKNLYGPGLEAYETALKLDPQNAIAKRRAELLRKRLQPSPRS
ncbi:tetratricopeptide repeat protein [Synechococcus sp. H65.1]|uniref:tetratricopeptide repeat protein n=1 Tax=unclassified Synechococcus TaxID=2626047 RepID=UPI0039C28794